MKAGMMVMAMLSINIIIMLIAFSAPNSGLFVDTTIFSKVFVTPNNITTQQLQLGTNSSQIYNATPTNPIAGSSQTGSTSFIGIVDFVRLIFAVFRILLLLVAGSIVFWYNIGLPFPAAFAISAPFIVAYIFTIIAFLRGNDY